VIGVLKLVQPCIIMQIGAGHGYQEQRSPDAIWFTFHAFLYLQLQHFNRTAIALGWVSG
jgi:hypothetical protein